MALLDLSLVTEALITLVKEGIDQSEAWSGSGSPNVTGLPPDQLKGNDAVGIYLYHVTEEAAHKNQVWPQRPATPIRFSPMGINLHYLLTAHAEFPSNEKLQPLREQLLYGLALKTLHDYPIIDDLTMVGSVQVFPTALQAGDNRIRIQTRPVQPNEAISNWTSGSQPLRLSYYFEVNVVLLEPERPDTGGGRVLTRRVRLFTGGLPRLNASRSVVTFTIPGESTPRQVDAQPAQVAYGDELVLLGENLFGDAVTLLVRGSGWSDAVEADPAWGGVSSGERFYATARDQVGGRAVVPGTYDAFVRVTTAGENRLTNGVPFQVTPTANVPATIPATAAFSITGGIFQHAEIKPESVRVLIGGADLRPRVGLDPPAAGEFKVIDGGQIDVLAPAGLIVGETLPVRVIVNGAESAPRWAQVT